MSLESSVLRPTVWLISLKAREMRTDPETTWRRARCDRFADRNPDRKCPTTQPGPT
jgi:hypothetical protein